MNNEIELIDIAEDLLILNKYTIDELMQLENCADCIALYVFYYKTAKWQKTNQIKATDEYVKKSLKWGRDKIMRTKAILKQHGLIDIVQVRKDDKIAGWYVRVNYLVEKKKLEDCKVVIKKSQNQQVANPTSTEENTNALKQYIKCLETEIEMLKIGNTKTKRFTPPTLEEVKAYCQERHNNVDPEKWYDFYQSKGWKIGNNTMKDWKAAVRTWERNNYGNSKKTPSNSFNNIMQHNYNFDALEREFIGTG